MGLFRTRTTTGAEVVARLEASTARAANVYSPSDAVVESHDAEYGDVESVAKTLPFRKNATRLTVTLSLALAVIVTAPPTTEPFAGKVRDAVGGTLSVPLATVTERLTLLLFPARSTAV